MYKKFLIFIAIGLAFSFFSLCVIKGTPTEINIKHNETNISDGTGSYDFGNILVNSTSSAITFTIENLGESDLELTGNPIVAISGTNAGMFSITQPTSTTIAPSSNATFSITFTPTSLGTKTATISIENNDTDENPYDFAITGVGVGREINIKQDTTNIPDGTGSYDFGNILVNSTSSAITFTIENLGESNLELTGNPIVAISGIDAGMFSITQPTSTTIAPSGNATFSITFTPTSLGTKTATISIENNDTDENPYDFAITGVGIEQEINIRQGTTNISDGTGTYDFGDVMITTSSSSIIFTIENLGEPNLELTGNPIVAISGIDAGMFSITQPASTTIAPDNDTTFTITFRPTTTGTKTATISIANNDTNENPYDFTITGNGLSNIVANPTFTPTAGSYSALSQVEILTSTSGASIRYTLDGTEPNSTTGTLYENPISVAGKFDLKVKAIAYKTGMVDSSVVDSNYKAAPIVIDTDSTISGAMRPTSLAIDSNNKIHISYYVHSGSDLKYATNIGGSWATTTVDNNSAGNYNAIALDSNDNPYISYHSRPSADSILKLAKNVGGSWATEDVDTVGNVGFYNSIAIDDNNKIHIAYMDNSYYLKYATNVSGSWTIENIDTNIYSATSIKIDSNGYVHISCVNRSSKIRYITNSSGSWVGANATSAGGYGQTSAAPIVLDSNDKVHIAFWHISEKELRYITNASGSWPANPTTLDTEGDTGLYTSIAIDNNDKLHISYYNSTDGDLRYITNASSSWVTYNLDSLGDCGQYTSTAADNTGKVHICYYEQTSNTLRYITSW